MKEMKILSPTAILGYGFPMASFEKGMAEKPDVIAVDAGSTDPGPYYLGAGISFTDRMSVKRDLKIMINACCQNNIPLIIGTAGGCGAKPHLDWNVDIIKEIAAEDSLHFTLASIPADLDKELVLENLKNNKIQDVTATEPLTREDIEKSTYIVAQMGHEPIIEALKQGAQVIVSGRTYDPACFAALPIHLGYDEGLALHLGKILECASIAAVPGSGSDCMMGYLGEDYFKVKPLNETRKCTILSVSAHTLYEKSNPYILPGPGGTLNLEQTQFIQETENTVRVTGTRHIATPQFYLKLEGAKKIGYRTVTIAGCADPVFIEKVEEIIQGVKDRTKDNFGDTMGQFELNFKIYGLNGVSLFGDSASEVPEIGILIDAVAETQENANTILSFARSTMLHFGYPGRISTAGNLAFPYSPSDLKSGEVYAFSLYHIMEGDPVSHFPVHIVQL